MRIPHGLRAALAGQGGTPAPSTDANFENTVLLLHGDGTNGAQNNTFTDGSTNNFTITRSGNATQGTFSPYGDNWSNYFDGTGDYLSVANSSSFAFGTGDFTVEFWLYANSSSTAHGLVASDQTGNYWASLIFSNLLYWQNANGSSNLFSTSYSNYYDQWTHVAFVRNSGTVRLYLNGVQITSASDNTNYTSTSGNIDIGRDQDNSALLNGYISNLRIVKGTAVYTSNFTPSTTPLTAITNTALLTCQSNRFRDASTNNFTITRNGDVSVQQFSPFSPAAAYSSSTIGGSGYFDGTGDYLTTPSDNAFDFGTGSFTVECWIYARASGYMAIAGTRTGDTSSTIRWSLFVSDTNYLTCNIRDTANNDLASITHQTTANLNAWNHCALVRNGTDFRLYFNGVQSTTGITSSAAVANSSTVVRVGDFDGSIISDMNGYISNLRIVKGTAVYTAAFTPPTSPLTAITNTSLLLNFTNGGIIDNTMMNDLETVGNAQISTSVKKYGTGSLAFDGTGDYLYRPSNPNVLGGGNWTVECWYYQAGGSGFRAFVSTRTAADGGGNSAIFLGLNGSHQLYYDGSTTGGIGINGSTTVAANTWYHIAVVRSGSTVTLYLNGTSEGTVTDSNSKTNPDLWVGGQSSSYNLNGYIDDLRITKGVARYTANFTPPTAALPDL